MAESELNIRLTEAYQIVPEASTAAIFAHHPQATYFSVGQLDRIAQILDSSHMNSSPARLPDRLARGDKLVHVEVTPPRSYSAKRVLENVRLLQNAGVDFVNVADTPTARLRMSAWAICHLVESELAQETVLHFPTRGRNLLRVQSDLLAAYAIGLRNVFVTMGDPVDIGDYPGAGNTYDLAPSALIALIKKKMNAGVDLRGRSIGDPTQFTVGCALNVASTNLSRELNVLERKLAGGADFALCQALYVPASSPNIS